MPASKIIKQTIYLSIPECNDTWQATTNGLLAAEVAVKKTHRTPRMIPMLIKMALNETPKLNSLTIVRDNCY